MQVRLLGPLEVVSDDGDAVPLPGARQRALLAVLAIHAGEVVSTGRLIDDLWGDEPLANPKNALQQQVSQLRRALRAATDGPLLAARPPGYVLDVEPAAVDLAAFERQVEEGRAVLDRGDADRAAVALREALGLWRGPALEEFEDQPFARGTIARLEELRLAATERRIEADLACGKHAELIGELEGLVASHPLRERLRGQLMLALYRSGRQADALEVFHDTRTVLGEGLGIDPGPELERLYETVLRHEDQVPARAPEAAPAAGDLPEPLTSFVGRDEELERVVGLLGGGRLLTLTGPGGVGKTRLAIEAALRARDSGDAPDGAWMVELAALSDPEDLVEAVAESLGLREGGGLVAASGEGAGAAETAARLTAALRGKRALLVLDNCEHLIEAVAALARELLAAARDLTVLCTSREALGVSGETVWSVPSLSVPSDSHGVPAIPETAPPAPEATSDGPEPERLLRHGAVRLFADRVREADPDFALTATTAPLVISVCRRLDGIPLALELAAARTRALGLAEVARRLDDRFRLLKGGVRASQPRQRTLQAVVDWSWGLLDDEERALFRRMSVFAGGATLPAVEAVCGDADTDPVDALSRLVDKSLVSVDRGAEPVRYQMLETLRAYAAARLEESGEAAATRARHAEHLAAFVGDVVGDLRFSAQLEALRRIQDEQDNLRAALSWLAEHDVDLGARVAGDLGWYWHMRGTHKEGLRWLTQFDAADSPRDRAVIAVWRGYFRSAGLGVSPARTRDGVEAAAATLREHGSEADHALAELISATITLGLRDEAATAAHLGAARDAAGRSDDEGFAATADFLEGMAGLSRGDFDAGRGLVETALGRFEALGIRWGQIQCLMALVTVAETAGAIDRAVELTERGLMLAAELGARDLVGHLRTRRANLAALQGDLVSARASVDQARRLAADLGNEALAMHADNAAGLAAARSGDLAEAMRCHERALAFARRAGLRPAVAYTLGRLGGVAERSGDLERARRLHREGFDEAVATRDPRAVAFALEGLAATLAAGGEAEEAAALLGAAAAARDSVGLPLADVERADVDRAESAAIAALGSDRFAEAVARGRAAEPSTLPAVRG